MMHTFRASCAVAVLTLLMNSGVVSAGESAGGTADNRPIYMLVPALHPADGPAVMGHIERISSDGARTVLKPEFANPVAMAADHAGNLYVVDHLLSADRRGAVYRIAPDETMTFVDYAIPLAAPADGLNDKYAIEIAFDSLDNLYVLVPTLRRQAGGDVPGHLDKLSRAGVRTAIGPAFANPAAMAIDSRNNLYVVDHDVATDPAGKVYRISPDGRARTVCAAVPNTGSADRMFLFRNIRLDFDAAGNLLVLEPSVQKAVTGQSVQGHIDRISAGGARSSIGPLFVNPVAMAAAGDNVYVVEHALDVNRQGRLFRISSSGNVSDLGVILPAGAVNAGLYQNYRICLTAPVVIRPASTTTSTLAVAATTSTKPTRTTPSVSTTSTTAKGQPTTTSTIGVNCTTTTTAVAGPGATTTTLPAAAAAVLTVRHPSAAGIVVERGGLCKVLWSSGGLAPDLRLKIELLNGSGTCWTLADAVRNTGEWKWKVQGTYPDGEDYRIRISAADGSASDDSDFVFAVGSAVSLTVVGPAEAAAGSETQYRAAVYFNFGPAQDVTSAARWSENSASASISKGCLKTKPAKSDQLCAVTAAYKGLTGSLDVTVKGER